MSSEKKKFVLGNKIILKDYPSFCCLHIDREQAINDVFLPLLPDLSIYEKEGSIRNDKKMTRQKRKSRMHYYALAEACESAKK